MAQFKTLHYYVKGNLTKKLPCIMPRNSSPVDTSPVDQDRLEALRFIIFMLLAGTMAVLDVASVLLIVFLVHRGI